MPWETDDSTGLLGHFIGTIDSSVWTTDSQKADPNAPFLSWHVTVDDVLQENYQGTVPETMIVNLTIGKGWTEDEAGETVEHTDGLEVFKGSTAYGKVISMVAGKSENYGSNAVVLDGDGPYKAEFSTVSRFMQEKGYDDPRVSSIWEGLTFEFRGIGFKYRNTEGDPYQLVLPVRHVVDQATPKPAKAKGATKKAASKPAPADTPDTSGVWQAAGADEDLASTLHDLVTSSSTHTEFAKNALQLEGVRDSSDLTAAVMDEGNFPS